MPTPEEWRNFHYPKKNTTPLQKSDTFQLVDVVQNSTIIQGAYALCKAKQKTLTIKTKIVRK